MAKILIVEDDINLQNNLKEYLILYDYEVWCASNGVEALKILSTILPDVIVCDIMMPLMDGHSFLQEKIKDIRYQPIPLIHITAKTDVEEKLTSLHKGAIDYLFKPFSLKELVYKINNIIKLKDSYQSEIHSNALPEENSNSELAFKSKFMELLRNHYHSQTLTIEEAAYKLDMSISTLQRWLTRYFKNNFSDLLKEYRLEKARLLLLNSDKTIEVIAKLCGISSQSYFSRIFKEAYQLPPIRFRLQNVKKDKS